MITSSHLPCIIIQIICLNYLSHAVGDTGSHVVETVCNTLLSLLTQTSGDFLKHHMASLQHLLIRKYLYLKFNSKLFMYKEINDLCKHRMFPDSQSHSESLSSF